MEQIQTLQEQKKQFLEQVANEYGFFRRDREIFLARFDAENGNSKNTEVSQFLGMDTQEFQDYLGKICDRLDFKSTNQKGRNKKGESRWEKAFIWLWNEKFIQQNYSNNSRHTNSEAAEKLINNSREVCQEILISTEKQRLTTNPLTNIDGTTFDYQDVCISLGLMERKKQRKIHKNFSTDGEYNEYEVTR
ncbi:MAG: hypothetical protein AAGJ08_28190 [Cyanobacteria bacterium P01_H01_bin.35]